MLRWFIADLRTGRQLIDIQVMAESTWSRSLNAPEKLTAVLDMQDPATIALRPRQTIRPGRSVLAVAVGDVILAAGPVWAHDYDRDQKTLRVTAVGLWSYFDHRYLLPLAAATADVATFIVSDPASAGKTMPNAALATNLSNLEYGTIAKRWVQQAQAWTGGNVPVVFEADRAGGRERNADAVDFKNIGTLLTQLTQLEDGPDIRFKPQFAADRLGVQFLLQTGTDANPLITGTAVHQWTVGVPGSGVSALKVGVDATTLASVAWASAGRSVDSVLVSRSTDPTLTDLGFPLFESLDTSHSTVVIQDTLDGYSGEATTFGRAPLETWTFTVEAARQPLLGAYWEGDWCDITIPAYDPDQGHGDPYVFEQSTPRRRIVAFDGNAKGLTVNVTTQAAVNG
ncbi:MAG: hypothetical protein J0I33_07795 [Microbacterium ginsengisoli]|uniref:hypothetical protein n=1 Tax=Microbacterium TaxID=33882 RepID=UPI0006FC946B|nr:MULTISPECIES: hypothetical protein [unclassified Microbacterium]KQR97699.1 hypothetical protein ASF93_13300 [Microbacterium sp. Leaf347]KQS01722.1 hypothetical protein ASG00_09815 [Microbacterium sp. Leaf351]MBN9198526.1 hypothetical protein [Microbacterium ginsengisoli]OJU78090.1 MAG: hypothetical protein BGO15_02500 [Microbacterium sp. 71-23]